MSDPATTDKSEPTPFERMQALASQVLSVPKAEVDRREKQWRERRKSDLDEKKKSNPLPREHS